MLSDESLRRVAVLMLFLLPLVTQAADEDDYRLHGVAETRAGEKLEGWIRFDRDAMTLTEFDEDQFHQLKAGQLKEVRLQLRGHNQREGDSRESNVDGMGEQELELMPSGIAVNGFRNPGFELGKDDDADSWGTALGCRPRRTDADAHDGDYSMHCFMRNEGSKSSEGHLSQKLGNAIVGGVSYALSFWVRLVDAGPGYVQQYHLNWTDAAGQVVGTTGFRPFRVKQGEWEEVTVKVKAPESASGVIMMFRFVTGAVAGGGGEVYIDNLSFRPLDSSATRTGVVLKGGAFLSGEIPAVAEETVTHGYLNSRHLKIPRQNVAGLQLGPISPARVAAIWKLEDGCSLRSGDYFVSSLLAFDQDEGWRMQSPLFGNRHFPTSQVAFVKLGGFKKSKANFEVHTRSGSRLRADWLMLDGKRALVKDNSFCWINIDPGDVAVVFGVGGDEPEG